MEHGKTGKAGCKGTKPQTPNPALIQARHCALVPRLLTVGLLVWVSWGMMIPRRLCLGSLQLPSLNSLPHSLALSCPPPELDFVALVTPAVCHDTKSITANPHPTLCPPWIVTERC